MLAIHILGVAHTFSETPRALLGGGPGRGSEEEAGGQCRHCSHAPPSQSIARPRHSHPGPLQDPCWPHAEALLSEKAEVAHSEQDNKGHVGTSLERGF